MAYPPSRSANGDLHQGAVDGTYFQKSPNRGGIIGPDTEIARRDLSPTWYGSRREAHVKELPDATMAVTPTYQPTAPSEGCCSC